MKGIDGATKSDYFKRTVSDTLLYSMMGLGGGGPFFPLGEISGIGRQADVHDKKIEFTGNAHLTR